MSNLPARARIPAVARRDFLDAIEGLPVTADQLRYLTWFADSWDQPTLNAFADAFRAARTEGT